MFTRLFSMFMAVLILVLGVVGVLTFAAVNNEQIDTRLESLKDQAREIAYLAAQSTDSTASLLLGIDSASRKLLAWKATEVYNEFGGYILVVDRRGRVMDNMQIAYAEDPDFVASLNSTELNEALRTVLSGQEVSVRAKIGDAPTFTVGVPFVQDATVLGAVLIQTEAQVIEGGTNDLLAGTAIAALAAAILSAVMVFLYVRSITKPLTSVTRAAGALADGEFAVRVPEGQNVPEIHDLAHSFNIMADKLSEVENSRREFVANVSHELRSPITSIRGFVEGMEDGTIPAQEHDKYLKIVKDETVRLSKLIAELLALSRLERDDAALNLTDFDMNEMLRRCVIRRVNDLEDKQMDVETDFALDPCIVHADSDRVEQVVVNLMDNALKFTPKGGRIDLMTRESGGKILVTVKDNGAGISAEDRPKVFDRFFTADRAHTSGKGTGLGLSICKRIMEFHGQSIWLEDTKEGAAFSFTLAKGSAPVISGGKVQ